MKKILSENQILIAKRGVSLVVVFAVLIVAIVAVSPNRSFGWFSENTEANANGMSVQTEIPDIEIYYRADGASDWIKIDLSSPIDVAGAITSPGTTATFEIKIVNKSNYDITVKELGLAAPAASEEVANANGVYLSTELYTTLVSVKPEGSSGTGYTLDNPPALSESGVALRTGKIDYMEYVSDSQSVTLSPEGDVVFKISIMFLNREISQNDYKNFGKPVNGTPDGVCSRRLYCTFDW